MRRLIFVIFIAMCVRLTPTIAWAGNIETVYPSEMLREWQHRMGTYVTGVYRDEVEPVLTAEERRSFARLQIEFPLSSPGMEPFAFWRDGENIHLSTASLKMLTDLLVAYAWLGANHRELSTVNDYVLMLAYWRGPTPPPMPRLALGVPDNARGDPATDRVAALFIHDALLFVLAHELGHVLHHDLSGASVSPAQSQAYETAADRFALDLLGRIGRLPAGISTFFQLAIAYDSSAGRQTHPLSSERLRQLAADIDVNAVKYAKDARPETLAGFKALSDQLQIYADLVSDTRAQAFQADRGRTIAARDLAPRRRHEIIARPLDYEPAGGPFGGKLIGTITISGVPLDVEVELQNRSGRVTGEYGGGGQFGHLDGFVVADTLTFDWLSGNLAGRGLLHRSGDVYEGSAGLGDSIAGTQWQLRTAAESK